MKTKTTILVICLILIVSVGIAQAGLYDGNPAPITYYKLMWKDGFPQIVKCVQVLPNMIISAGTTPYPYWNVGMQDWSRGVCAKCTAMG